MPLRNIWLLDHYLPEVLTTARPTPARRSRTDDTMLTSCRQVVDILPTG
jgi:hypothetical protein